MSEITYEKIESLIAAQEQERSTMKVSFRCPVTDKIVSASGSIQKGTGLVDKARQSTQKSVLWSLRSAVSRAVRGALGHGVAGRVGSEVAGQLMTNANDATNFSADEKREAIVRAFEGVASQFVWNGTKGSYVHASAGGEDASPFGQQLASAPVEARYDRGILARMLVEVASADGNLGADEREFIGSFLSDEMGSVDDLAGRDRLSTVELEETAAGASRETMLMLGWALAHTDEDVADAEVARLGELAAGLGVAADRAAELRKTAQHYLVDQALDAAIAGGSVDDGKRKEALDLAARIGIDPTEAQRAEIRWRKRHGIV